MTHNWPSREEWAERRRTNPPIPKDAWATQPPNASRALADYASADELKTLIASLKQTWRDLLRDVKAAAKHSNAKIEASAKRRLFNGIIAQLEEPNAVLPIYSRRDDLSPLFNKIEERYNAACWAAHEAQSRWRMSFPADVSDAAWAAELECRQQWEADRERDRQARERWKAEREEGERQAREDAIRRSVETRARRREVQRGIGSECWQHVLAAVERTTAPAIDTLGDYDGA